jgi:DNA-binding NarL/FixJ family response regulator
VEENAGVLADAVAPFLLVEPVLTAERSDPRTAAETKVLLVDDHKLVRAGLVALLETADDLDVVGEAADGQHALLLARDLRPDVVLMDLSMPVLDGVEATRRLVAEQPGARVLVLTSFMESTRVIEALSAGAVGYLLKDCDPEDLIAGVRAAARGHTPLDPRVTRPLLPAATPPAPEPPTPGPPAEVLSSREAEVLTLVARGLPNKQIARVLGISGNTVKVHLTSIYRTLGINDRATAALWARDHLPGVGTVTLPLGQH